MKNLSIFQLILLGVFFLFFLTGMVVVGIYSSKSSQGDQAVSVSLWGTLDAGAVRDITNRIESSNRNLHITYLQKDPSSFEYDLVEAIATGVGPDMVLLRQDSLASTLTKISPISYDLYPAREFRDTFIQEGEWFLAPSGVLAVPFSVDPLVMYWNRDLFSQAGIANPPRYWDELFYLAERLTAREGSGGTISQSAVALGEYANVMHAKDILATLLLQSGNKIATWNASFTAPDVLIRQSPVSPESVLSFFTQFSDPRKPVYSWSRTLPNSQTAFLSNRLAVYFGFASEVRDLRAKSPNLNFDVTYVPESRNGNTKGAFGNIYGLAVLRTSRNPVGSLSAIREMTTRDSIAAYTSASYLPPVRRDISAPSNDPLQAIFWQSALVSRSWLDPNHLASDAIFKDMIESVEAGITSTSEAVNKADQQLRLYTTR